MKNIGIEAEVVNGAATPKWLKEEREECEKRYARASS
jgi:hypothetical protein